MTNLFSDVRRAIVKVEPVGDDGLAWEVTYSCGHKNVWKLVPPDAEVATCTDCLDALVERLRQGRA